MLRRWLVVVTLLLGVAPASGYIAVSANRLTLSEVMLEFPTVVVLTLDKFDAGKGAYLYKVSETLQGKAPAGPHRQALLVEGKLPKQFAGLTEGDRIVSFLGSPDNRTLHHGPGGWYLTSPDQGWERFTQKRDDFTALCAGTPDELATAIRALTRGGAAVLPVRPPGTPTGSRLFVRFDANEPHRRWPALDPASKGEVPLADVRMAALDADPGVRQQALVRLARESDAAPLLVKALTDAHAEVRLAAAAGLVAAKGKADEVVPALIRALGDEDRFVCSFAASALAGHGADARTALPRLAEALKDRNYDHDYRPHRAAEAAEAILKIAPESDAAQRAIDLLVSDRMLNDRRPDAEGTRTAAARALGRCGPRVQAVLPQLLQRLKDDVVATRIAAAEAAVLVGAKDKDRERASAVLAAEMTRGDVATRVQAIRAAANAGCRDLLAALGTLVKDPVPEVREAAAQAVTLLGDK